MQTWRSLGERSMNAVDTDTQAARYLTIVHWARVRYATAGTLVLSVGGELSAYSRIERAAWRRYMETGNRP